MHPWWNGCGRTSGVAAVPGEAWAAASGVALVGGVWLLLHGLRRRPVGEDRVRYARRRRRIGRATAIRAGLGVAIGVLLLAVTGWPAWLLIAPAAVLGLPWLLSDPPQRDVEVLTALDRWLASLQASLQTGTSISDAVRASHRQAPELLVHPLRGLVTRLDQRWTLREALAEFADELDEPDADAVVAALVLAAERGGTGAAAALRALSESTRLRLRSIREVETERAKPRIVVRQITLITVVVLGVGLVVARDYFAPYASAWGQVLLLGLIGCFAGSLVWMRRMTTPPARPRMPLAAVRSGS